MECYSCEDALRRLKDSLNIFSMKQKLISGYCKNIVEYLKADNATKLFKNIHAEKLLELKINQLKAQSSRRGLGNAVAVTLKEHEQYYQEVYGSTPSNETYDDDVGKQVFSSGNNATSYMSSENENIGQKRTIESIEDEPKACSNIFNDDEDIPTTSFHLLSPSDFRQKSFAFASKAVSYKTNS
jgi:hypothetical protein